MPPMIPTTSTHFSVCMLKSQQIDAGEEPGEGWEEHEDEEQWEEVVGRGEGEAVIPAHISAAQGPQVGCFCMIS